MASGSLTKTPPHDTEAEKAVLGGILIDPAAVSLVAEIIGAQHFYVPAHGIIFTSMLTLFEKNQPVDVVTLSAELKKHGELTKIGGGSYLADLIDTVPTSAYVEHYARIVKAAYVKRSLISMASHLVERSFEETGDVKILLNEAETGIFALSQAYLHQDFVTLKSILAESFERLESASKGDGLRGIGTGFKHLDNKLAGMQDSNLIILAARPGIGKTSMALNVALHAALVEKQPVGIFSLEMSKEELVDRLLVGHADIDAWRLKTGKLTDDDMGKLTQAMGDLSDAPIYIDDTPGATILEMRTKARKLKIEKGLKLVIIDYLQLVNPGKRVENRVQEVSYISQNLKNLARELKVPVLALSQLSRAIEHRGEKKPQLADLRESGCLAGSTLIMRADSGELIPIKNLVGEKDVLVWSMDSDYKIVPRFVSNIFSTGKKLVYTLKFRSGKTIEATGNHKFRTYMGWKRLDEVREGQKLALPRGYQSVLVDNENYSDNLLAFLAHMIGDGCFVPHQPIHYTSIDMKNIEKVRTVARGLFNIKGRVVKQENWYHVYLPSPYKVARNKFHPFRTWLKSEGLDLAHSYEKKLPSSLFICSNTQIALFLHHLWATDGCIKISKNNVSIYYATTSEKLAVQIQHLLLRLGVWSTIRKVAQVKALPNGEKKTYRPLFAVLIQGKENQLSFLRNIGCFGQRGEIVQKCVQILETLKSNPNTDTLDASIWQELIRDEKEQSDLTWRQVAAGLQMAYAGSTLFKSGVSRQRLSKLSHVLKSDLLGQLAHSDIYWDEVVSITQKGVEEVFDMTVPGTHNFIANDIVVHNSIEQDADVVMFLYYEKETEDLMDETKKMIKLYIAKHRNGSTGEIDLMFRGDRVKFYSVDHTAGI